MSTLCGAESAEERNQRLFLSVKTSQVLLGQRKHVVNVMEKQTNK